MRDPNLEKYNLGNQNYWLKEHQIKIFAEEFERIGFRIIHKMRALEGLANINRAEWDSSMREKADRAVSVARKEVFLGRIGHIDMSHHKYYWQSNGQERPKAIHPMESSDRIPEIIRGIHYNSWKDIARDLGYRER